MKTKKHAAIWPYAPIEKTRYDDCETYEWAYMKAELEGQGKDKTMRAYNAMFGTSPKTGLPLWFIRMVIYYNALEIGHNRIGKIGRTLNGPERAMLTCLNKMKPELLKSSRHLWHYLYLHDLEPVSTLTETT